MSRRQLTQSDALAILELVNAFSAVDTMEEYAEVVLVGLIEMIPCIDASYNELVPSTGRVRCVVRPDQGGRVAEFVPVFEQWMHQNPLVRHFEDTGDTRAMMWSDFMSLDDLKDTELYQEMFRPLGVASQMAVTLPTPPGIVVGFAVNGGPEGFSERDRVILNTLRPHLAHAYRSIQLRDELSALTRALEAGGWTGALANGDGIVESITDNAGSLAERTGIQLRVGSPLPDPLRAPFRRGVHTYEPSQPAVLSRPVRITREAGGTAGWYIPGPVAPHVVLIQTDIDAAARRLEASGLTPRQIEVALHLAQGGINAVIAARLGISEGTLRKHLECIYRTLEVHDRASAIACIRGW